MHGGRGLGDDHDPWEWRTLLVGIGRPQVGRLPIELSEIEGAPTLALHAGQAEEVPPPDADPSLGINLRPDADLSMRELVGALVRLREAGWERVAVS